MKEYAAKSINILGEFLGRRDVPALTKAELKKRYGLEQADVMVLFGGSILCGGDVLAEAMKNGVAKSYVIVGGAGHTTDSLRRQMEKELPGLMAADRTEAELFACYLKERYDLTPDLLECASTNCGNNITNLLALLKEHGISFKSIILVQDAAMELRMEAVLRKYVPNDTLVIHYAAYAARVALQEGELVYTQSIPGMWDMERYISLLMGEIPRLWDGPEGYGPKGKNYLVHVEIPQEVLKAFHDLKEDYGALVRKANPAYRSV